MPTDDTLPDKISEYLAEAFHGLLSAEGPKTLESFEDEALALAARAYGMALDRRDLELRAALPEGARAHDRRLRALATGLGDGREEFELLRKFADFHFSSELNATATLDDLSYDYMREYMVRIGAREDTRSLPKAEMARALGLVGGASGERARNFAVLMFAERPADFIPGTYVNVIREVEGTDRMTSEVFDGPVWVQAIRVPDYLEEAAMRTLVLRSPERTGHRTVYSWPRAMFAELATNAILHKDYSRSDYVGIYVYADRMTFVNHNRPLPPVTIEDLNERESFDGRGYVNPELKDMFFALGLIESFGSGVRRAKHAMRDNGSPALVYEPANDADDYTMVTAPVQPEFLEDGGAEAPGDKRPAAGAPSNGAELNSVEQAALAVAIRDGKVTSRGLEEEARVSRPTATKALRGLAGRGLLEWHGTSATDGFQYYSLPQ